MIENELIEEEIITRGLCRFNPETKCNKNYDCLKLSKSHIDYIEMLRKAQREGKNPFVYHTTFHVTPDPVFICPDKLPDKLKEMMEIN